MKYFILVYFSNYFRDLYVAGMVHSWREGILVI